MVTTTTAVCISVCIYIVLSKSHSLTLVVVAITCVKPSVAYKPCVLFFYKLYDKGLFLPYIDVKSSIITKRKPAAKGGVSYNNISNIVISAIE